MSNQNTQMRYDGDRLLEMCTKARKVAMLVKFLPLDKISAIRYKYFETKAEF